MPGTGKPGAEPEPAGTSARSDEGVRGARAQAGPVAAGGEVTGIIRSTWSPGDGACGGSRAGGRGRECASARARVVHRGHRRMPSRISPRPAPTSGRRPSMAGSGHPPAAAAGPEPSSRSGRRSTAKKVGPSRQSRFRLPPLPPPVLTNEGRETVTAEGTSVARLETTSGVTLCSPCRAGECRSPVAWRSEDNAPVHDGQRARNEPGTRWP